jgi:hypothetical protein
MGICSKFNRATRPTGRQLFLAAKPKPNSKNKMSAGADERLEGFRTREKGKWWCRRDG